MPLGGGIKAFEKLKSISTTSNIPVIFITAFPSKEVKKLVMDMGAEDFISKPFNSDSLIEKINTILNDRIDKPNNDTHNETDNNLDSLKSN